MSAGGEVHDAYDADDACSGDDYDDADDAGDSGAGVKEEQIKLRWRKSMNNI